MTYTEREDDFHVIKALARRRTEVSRFFQEISRQLAEVEAAIARAPGKDRPLTARERGAGGAQESWSMVAAM
ncbi:MAG: hypothetical protein M5U28_15225 [Sandaracinaceae bacterium]|nr:hypothetical protein [Sandaracinaceae bacterium]